MEVVVGIVFVVVIGPVALICPVQPQKIFNTWEAMV
jgi:hypothetical protein